MCHLDMPVRLARLNRPCFPFSPSSSSPVFSVLPVSLVLSRTLGASQSAASIRRVHLDALDALIPEFRTPLVRLASSGLSVGWCLCPVASALALGFSFRFFQCGLLSVSLAGGVVVVVVVLIVCVVLLLLLRSLMG